MCFDTIQGLYGLKLYLFYFSSIIWEKLYFIWVMTGPKLKVVPKAIPV